MSKENGGPAFPGLNAVFTGLDSDGQERHETQPSGGMTLRQYYMAHAPFTLSDARAVSYEVGQLSPNGEQLMKLLVQMRAGYADAMLAEGAK